MVVPPPMSVYQVQGHCPVNQVAFGPAGHSNDFAVLYADNALHIYTCASSEGITSHKYIILN